MSTKTKPKDLSGEIWVTTFDEEAAQDFRERVLFKSKEQPAEPIVIYIDSYGGYVDALAKMIETMDETPNPIVTVCMGKAMSCGAILLRTEMCATAADTAELWSMRYGGVDGSADVHNMYADATEVKRLNRYFLGLLAKDCEIPGGYDGLRKIIKARDGRDIYMDAMMAVEFGIADHAGIPQMVSVVTTEAKTTPMKKKSTKKGKGKL